MGPTTPTATTTTGRQPPQPGTPCRGQGHLCRRAPPHQGDREERTGAVGTPAATPPNQDGREDRTGAVGTPAAAPPNQVGREGKIGTVDSLAVAPPNQVGREDKIGTVGSLAAASPNRVVREGKTGAADTPAVAPPNQVRREERTGALDTPAAVGLEAGRRKATGVETTNAANEPGTPHGSTPVAAAAHAADVNIPLGTTHESKGMCPVNTTKGAGVHGSRRAPTEVTEGEGRMTLEAVPAAGSQSRSKRGREHSPRRQRDAPRTPKQNRRAYTTEDLREERERTDLREAVHIFRGSTQNLGRVAGPPREDAERSGALRGQHTPANRWGGPQIEASLLMTAPPRGNAGRDGALRGQHPPANLWGPRIEAPPLMTASPRGGAGRDGALRGQHPPVNL